MTPLVRCPACEGPVLVDETGVAQCVATSGRHLRTLGARQRVEAGETLADIIASEVDR